MEKLQDGGLENAPFDRFALITGAELAGRRAGNIIAPDSGEPAATFAAAQKAGEQMLNAALFPKLRLFDRNNPRAGLDLDLTLFDAMPKGIIDDPQLWDFGENPGFRRVQTRHPVACLWVFGIAQPVPDQPADAFLKVIGCGD